MFLRKISKISTIVLALAASAMLGAMPVCAEDAQNAYEDMITDVAYIDDGDTNHLLDLFGTQSVSEATPTIVEVHGGGFIGGSKETNTDHSIYYAEHGYLVVTPDYSKLPNVTYKEAIQELFTVYQWAADHAEEYHFDLDHMFLSGDSAGGFYVLMTAAIIQSPELQEYFEVTPPSYEFKGYVTSCPMADLLSMRDDLGQPGPAGYTSDTIGEEILLNDDLMSHLDLYTWVDPETYPYIYMMSTPEDKVTRATVEKFEAFLNENGIDHEFHDYENQTNELAHVFNINKIEYEESIQANDDILAYLDSLCE